MSNDERIAQLRARLVSLRGQRQRLGSRAAEADRRASAAINEARSRREQARAAAGVAYTEVIEARAQASLFESPTGPSPAVGLRDWQAAHRAAAADVERAREKHATAESQAAEADVHLGLVLRQQEADASALAAATGELDQEIDQLQKQIADLEVDRPPPEAPDASLRDALIERLRLLDAERTWTQQEIGIREERLRRLSLEAGHIRSLLELHLPAGTKDLVPTSPTALAADRATPAWRAAVVDLLTQAGEPLHYRELAIALAKSGQGLSGQDPAETLLAALSRDPTFERVGRGLYWLTGKPRATTLGSRVSPHPRLRAYRPRSREEGDSGPR